MEEARDDLPPWATEAIAGFKRGAELNRKISARALPLGLLVGVISGGAFFLISRGSWYIAVVEFVSMSLIFVLIFRYAGKRGIRMAQGQIDSAIALAQRKPHPTSDHEWPDDSLL